MTRDCGFFAVILSALLIFPAQAQQRAPRIFDIKLGTHVDDLPANEFVEPSCGTNGGPQGLPVRSFNQFRKCRPEASGLREIWFEYDDTAEYAALARRQPGRRRTTSLLDQPVILSLLIDDNARVQGYRIFSDTRAEAGLRQHAHEIALHFKARFDLEHQCRDVPAAEGETPIDGEFVKEICEKMKDGVRIVTEARFYYRAGQQFYDPNTGQPMANAFESFACVEVAAASPRVIERSRRPVTLPAPPSDSRGRFLAGLSSDCAGCDLTETDLRYRDLTGANLEGAKLDGALLHRVNLTRANLRNASLSGANLNRANLSFANLAGATIVNAMLFQSHAQRADFTSADLRKSMMGRADLSFARITGAHLDNADLGEARLADANLSGATMTRAYFPLAVLARADLSHTMASAANFAQARMRGSNLANADLSNADLSSADLVEINLSDAILSGAKLFAADMTRARLDGANLSQTIMPDNTRRP